MIIDCHAHFEPRMLAADQVIAKMDAAGVDRIVFIPAMNDPLPHTPELLLKAVRVLLRAGARPVVEAVHRHTIRDPGFVEVSGEKVAIYPQPDNASVAALVAENPERFASWIFLNPAHDPDVLDTLERWRHEPGMIGVKLHPHWHDWELERAWPLLARCEELGLPVLIHFGFGPRGDFREMCERFPRLTVISAHAGFPFFQALWKHADRYPNLHVDLSSPYLSERLVRATVARMGAHRCLYGSDAPYGFHEDDGSYDYREILGWVGRLNVSSTELDGILGARFAELTAR
ncbi:MAG: amidohydrolase [Deltaproteobacteria bacterium]|nr:MAG: amidohydrolase [Deltaproteobacteria bacterium]